MRVVASAIALLPIVLGFGCSAAPKAGPPETRSFAGSSTSAAPPARKPELALIAHAEDEGVAIPHPGGLLPAGLCGFNPYLSPPCDDELLPRFAVVLAELGAGTMGKPRPRPHPALLGDMAVRPHDELREAERAMTRGRQLGLPAGYPFAVSYDEMPAADGRRALAVVAGLFILRDEAEEFIRARSLSARVVALGGTDDALCLEDDHLACMKGLRTVVEVTTGGAAYAQKDLTALEERLSSVTGGEIERERERSMATMKPVCTVQPGHVALTDQHELYGFSREFAPVTCPDGSRAWTAWRNTRLQSVVVQEREGVFIHQVVSVSCDSPTVDRRAFGAAPVRTQVAVAGCRG